MTPRSHAIVWTAYAVTLMTLPLLFDSVLGISILNQLAIAVVFSLSYNLLLGQGGMLSFGHAVYFGLGGYLSVHALNLIASGIVTFSIVLMPLVGGLAGLLTAAFIGSFSTRKAGTAFAMISLGIAELVAACALIFVDFFGGEAGISGDRTLGPAFFGSEFLRDIEVYYVAAFWTFIATALMYLYTLTPVGRLANAVRDNPERVQFIGYNPRWVRFVSFCASGLFAGVAGGLFALSYEFLSAENLDTTTSGRVLLMAYLGGVGYFVGPMLGAVILTLMSTLLIDHTANWQLYLGILFILTVVFLPGGFAGLIMMHEPACRHGTLIRLAPSYALTALPGLIFLLGCIALLELFSAEDTRMIFMGLPLARSSPLSWALLIAVTSAALILTRRSLPQLKRAWFEANRLPEHTEQ